MSIYSTPAYRLLVRVRARLYREYGLCEQVALVQRLMDSINPVVSQNRHYKATR
jgi:hypothetical protein